MFCTNCGKEIKDDSKFCENCGTPVQNIEAPADPAPAAEIPEEPTVNIFSNDIPAPAAPVIPEPAEAPAVEEKIPELTLDAAPEIPETPVVPDIPELEKTAPVAPDYASASAQTEPQPQAYQPYQPQQAEPQPQAYQPYQPQPQPQQQAYQPYQPAQQPNQGGTTYQSTYQQPPKKKKTGLIIAIAVIAVVAILAVVGLGGGAKGGYKTPEALYDAYFKAVAANDNNAIKDMMPKAWYDYTRAQFDNETEYWEYMDYSHYFDVMGEKLDYYDVMGLEQKITDVSDFNSNVKGLNCTAAYQYKLDVYFQNGATEYFYFDLFEIGGKYWLMYVE